MSFCHAIEPHTFDYHTTIIKLPYHCSHGGLAHPPPVFPSMLPWGLKRGRSLWG